MTRAQAAAARFASEQGAPSNPRRVNFYGHFQRGQAAKRWRINRLHEEALREDAARKEAA